MIIFYIAVVILLLANVITNIRILGKPVPKIYDGSQAEGTTKLPLNFAAQTCHHDWEQLDQQVLEGIFEKKLVLVLKCKGCGSIDKTIESVQPKCKHSWDSMELTVPSAHEMNAKSTHYSPPKATPENAWQWGKQSVLISTCNHCGETHETRVENTAFGMKEFAGEEKPKPPKEPKEPKETKTVREK